MPRPVSSVGDHRRGQPRLELHDENSDAMVIDTSEFPVVFLDRASAEQQPPQVVFTELEALMKRNQLFVIIGLEAPGKDHHEHKHAPQEGKNISLWFKRNKANIRSTILGMIQIERSAATRAVAGKMLTSVTKAMGFPTYLAASKEDAIDQAKRLLAER